MSNQLFVYFPPPGDRSGLIVFGQNAVGPRGEVHELVYLPRSNHEDGASIGCSMGAELAQVSVTHAVVFSRAAGCWGAECGANEWGVVVGCGTVKVRRSANVARAEGERDGKELLGADLVRLGLERGRTAKEAMEVISALLNAHKTGVRSNVALSNPDADDWANCFMIIDQSEAWILETVGCDWAAERVTSGARSMTGGALTIRDRFDASSVGLMDRAVAEGWWKGGGEGLDWAGALSAEKPRDAENQFHLEGAGDPQAMLQLLRDSACQTFLPDILPSSLPGSLPQLAVNSSQMSVLRWGHGAGKVGEGAGCHWFTATPDPGKSLFKPFVFSEQASVGDKTVIADDSLSAAACGGGSGGAGLPPQGAHALWGAHNGFLRRLEGGGNPRAEGALRLMRELEQSCLQDVSELLTPPDSEPRAQPTAGGETSFGSKVGSLFQHIVELEMNFYG